ncbi:hypothetical protein Lalb_Chr19g0137581 [Lupinus albus]|uniref:Uncharacterized protein n=1 Tax=Lupinus albus TaxID=3870 RepID=A0A6A4NVQ6_LUPAL|nr:hypothetical protein Lalb_Chr19g0137581 [Lupinus albus]
MKNYHSTIIIVLFWLYTCWDSGMSTPGKIYVYNIQEHESVDVHCSGNTTKVSKVVPPLNQTELIIPSPKFVTGGCYGKVSYKDHILVPFVNLNKEVDKCEKSCYFLVFNTSIYRLDQAKYAFPTWVLVHPIIWLP